MHITKYKWCLNVPPRCPDVKQEHRTVEKNIVSNKIIKPIYNILIILFGYQIVCSTLDCN